MASVEEVTKAYQEALGRAPDSGGLAAYQKGGLSYDQMVSDMKKSPEGQKKLGTTPTYSSAYKQEAAKNNSLNSLVTKAYWQALGRKPDSGGLSTYTNAIRNGTVQDFNHLMTILYTSEEYKGLGPSGVLNRQYVNSGQANADKKSVKAQFEPYYAEKKAGEKSEYQYGQKTARGNFTNDAASLYDLMAKRGLSTSPAGYQDVFDLSRQRQRGFERATNLFNQSITELNREQDYNIKNALLGRKEEYSQRYYGDLGRTANQLENNVLMPYLSKYNLPGYGY